MARVVYVLTLMLSTMAALDVSVASASVLKTQSFLSPPFYLSPGSVINNYYDGVNFPRGHIAIKSFTGEVVDAYGVSVPLSEVYLHHWLVQRYYLNSTDPAHPRVINAGNSGVCNNLEQHFGLGSETRRTRTWVPDPYGVEIGNPNEIPTGYSEQWYLNVHAIDTRGVVNRWGCTECRCDLYNVTRTPKRYRGGLRCCEDRTRCKLRDGFSGGETRKFFLKYTMQWVEWVAKILPVRITMQWVEWVAKILPVRIYIFDVTQKNSNNSTCQIEYDVEPCSLAELHKHNKCVHSKRTSLVMPRGGVLVFGGAHQHAGGVGSTLFGQDGRVLCSSIPHYGTGSEAGNELGYIVGMSTCYPSRGSVRINDGEAITVVSNYSSSNLHTGVMGLFYIMLADK